VETAAEAAVTQTAFPKSTHWIPHSISQGYSGLAVLWGYLDSCFPEDRWDLTGREHIQLAGHHAQALQQIPAGIFSGLSGLGFGAWQLSRSGARYRRLLDSVDQAIVAQVRTLAADLREQKNGVNIGEFDVISGLSGVGAYLLCRRDQPAVAESLPLVVEALVELLTETNGVPRWHTPARLLWDEDLKDTYPWGNLNCGLAHGVPGVLAFLSLARQAGIAVPGLPEAIGQTARWLGESRCDDEWGVNWPTAVPLAGLDSPDGPVVITGKAAAAPEGPSRAAWCYGSPGIARALWLAGDALNEDTHRQLALSAMESVFRRPIPVRRIDSPTFCHGKTGLLQIALRFAHDTGYSVLVSECRTLAEEVLDCYRPESMLGFRNIEYAGREIDQPGLLDGAPGVALVLLAAATGVEPGWDRVFLLS
jgi:lantibiotic modifying enzyme